jgi:hypothetical protein
MWKYIKNEQYPSNKWWVITVPTKSALSIPGLKYYDENNKYSGREYFSNNIKKWRYLSNI